MKKYILLTVAFLAMSCTDIIDELPQNKIKNIEIIFTTTELKNDEIQITYFDNKSGNNISGAYKFEYDADGKQTPIILKFDDYKYRFLDGEAFRNNFKTSELKVQILINGELFKEISDKGSSTRYATVNFSFRITN